MTEIQEKPENTRTCEECKEKPTISPKHSLCASCMARRSNKNRPEKKKKDKAKGNKAARQEKIQQRGNTDLTIEFGKHVAVLKEIERLAEEEMRPVPLQVIYILKKYIKDKEITKSV